MKIITTNCCALAQLTAENDTTIEELKNVVSEKTEERKKVYERGDSSGKGQTCLFCIVTPNEDILKQNLEKLGFKSIHSFSRRMGYPEGELEMYVLNI